MLNVESWNLKHPKKVKELLAAQEKLEQAVHAPAPSNDGFLSADTLEAALNEHTMHTLYHGDERRQAINLARNTIERQLKAEVNNNLDNYVKQVEAIFNPAAEKYTEAVEKLPSGKFTADAVLGFSQEQREAYHTAREAAGVISWAADWLWELLDLRGQSLGGWGKYFLVCEPGSVAGLTCLFLEEEHTGEKGYDALLPPLLRAYVRVHICVSLLLRRRARQRRPRSRHVRAWMNKHGLLSVGT